MKRRHRNQSSYGTSNNLRNDKENQFYIILKKQEHVKEVIFKKITYKNNSYTKSQPNANQSKKNNEKWHTKFI